MESNARICTISPAGLLQFTCTKERTRPSGPDLGGYSSGPECAAHQQIRERADTGNAQRDRWSVWYMIYGDGALISNKANWSSLRDFCRWPSGGLSPVHTKWLRRPWRQLSVAKRLRLQIRTVRRQCPAHRPRPQTDGDPEGLQQGAREANRLLPGKRSSI